MLKAILGLVSAFVIAACGSSSSSPAAASSSLAFARCRRSHGMPNFPDPSAQGQIALGPTNNPKSPAFQTAQQACGPLPPELAELGVPVSESRRLAMVKLAECMRTHGIQSFPDPTTAPPTGATANVRQDGLFFALPFSIDHRSPAFRSATASCGLRLQ
jgi:hypothetical protein